MIQTLPGLSRTTRMLCAISIALLACAWPAFADHLERHFAVHPHPVIMVHNPSGKLTIQSWSKPEVLVIADHASNEVGVEAEQKGNLIEISTHLLAENVHPADIRADYAITVPRDAELQVHDDAGTVQVIQVFGDTAVETQTAGVDLEDVGGYLNVSTVGGSVDCIRCTGRVVITSFSGNLRLLQSHSPSMSARTTSGSILFDSDFLPNGLYQLRNYSGPIELLFSPTDSVTLQATSLRGQVNNEAGITPLARSPVRPSRYTQSMFGSINEGLARVEVTSFNGTININKRGE
jgi:DUF4097 and DUF4098 domain-containing protein YvlB